MLVACFLWLDRYEPEPLQYLVFCFAWGAFVSTATALAVNEPSPALFDRTGAARRADRGAGRAVHRGVTKALGPILLLLASGAGSGPASPTASSTAGSPRSASPWWRTSSTSAATATRAGVEQYGPATGAQNVFAIFIVRILFFGFAHPLFTSMTGVGLGIAARYGRPAGPLARPDRRPAAGDDAARHVEPAALAGRPRTGAALIMLYGYLGVMVPIFFAMVGFAIVAARLGGAAHRADPAGLRPGRLVHPAGGGRPGQPRPTALGPQLGPAGRRGRRAARRCATSSSPRPGWRCCATACSADWTREARPTGERGGGEEQRLLDRDHRVPAGLHRPRPADPSASGTASTTTCAPGRQRAPGSARRRTGGPDPGAARSPGYAPPSYGPPTYGLPAAAGMPAYGAPGALTRPPAARLRPAGVRPAGAAGLRPARLRRSGVRPARVRPVRLRALRLCPVGVRPAGSWTARVRPVWSRSAWSRPAWSRSAGHGPAGFGPAGSGPAGQAMAGDGAGGQATERRCRARPGSPGRPGPAGALRSRESGRGAGGGHRGRGVSSSGR